MSPLWSTLGQQDDVAPSPTSVVSGLDHGSRPTARPYWTLVHCGPHGLASTFEVVPIITTNLDGDATHATVRGSIVSLGLAMALRGR